MQSMKDTNPTGDAFVSCYHYTAEQRHRAAATRAVLAYAVPQWQRSGWSDPLHDAQDCSTDSTDSTESWLCPRTCTKNSGVCSNVLCTLYYITRVEVSEFFRVAAKGTERKRERKEGRKKDSRKEANYRVAKRARTKVAPSAFRLPRPSRSVQLVKEGRHGAREGARLSPEPSPVASRVNHGSTHVAILLWIHNTNNGNTLYRVHRSGNLQVTAALVPLLLCSHGSNWVLEHTVVICRVCRN